MLFQKGGIVFTLDTEQQRRQHGGLVFLLLDLEVVDIPGGVRPLLLSASAIFVMETFGSFHSKARAVTFTESVCSSARVGFSINVQVSLIFPLRKAYSFHFFLSVHDTR